MTESPEISIVVPTYREAGNIEPLVEGIAAAMVSGGHRFEIIIVDDDSGDGTVDTVSRLSNLGHPVRVDVRKDIRDLSASVLRGFRQAKGTYLVCMDADLSHPAEAIPRLIAPLRLNAADFVLGSRYVHGGSTEARWGLLRRLNSKAATLLARPLVAVKDPMSGFFALSRERFLEVRGLAPIGYKICLELLVRLRPARIIEIPIHFGERSAGESKLSLREQLHYLRHLARLYRHRLGRVRR